MEGLQRPGTHWTLGLDPRGTHIQLISPAGPQDPPLAAGPPLVNSASHLFHLSLSTGEVVVQGQAVEEHLEGLVHLAHFLEHRGFPEQSLKDEKER